MDREQAKQEIKERFADILQTAPHKLGNQTTYICPLCSSGSGKTGTGIAEIPEKPTVLHCFACGESGDIIHFYMKKYGCDFKEAFTALCDRLGIVIDGKADPQRQRTAPQPAQSKPVAADPQQDFTDYYSKVCNYTELPEAAISYLQGRGISENTARLYRLGFDDNRIIIPVCKHFYMGRSILPNATIKMKNTGKPVEIFNKAALYNENEKPVFVTEGVFDALSIIETGAEAVSINGAGNTKKLLQILKEKKTKNVLILAGDNDAPGLKATAELAAGLRELNIPFIVENVSGQHKDANEALTANKYQFVEAVEKAQRNICKPDNIQAYLRGAFKTDTDELKAQSNRKTWFENIDKEAGSIYAGLYVLGGLSAVGKTTFANQLADQMAAHGEHVLFFSMEQSRHEMVSKSLARSTAQLDMVTALTSLQIRTGQTNNTLATAGKGYANSVADRLSIIEGNFGCTVSYIKEYTEKYIKQNSVAPVVFIDYLQVIQPDVDPQTKRKPTDPKQIIDQNMLQLKRMSRTLHVPIFVLSSINRSNYQQAIAFESFMQSAGIEFTADVVWGLQLAVIHDDIFAKENKTAEKREKIEQAKKKMPRDIELVCLKNRFGNNYAVQFTYYQKYDYFVPAVSPEPKPGIDLSQYNIV